MIDDQMIECTSGRCVEGALRRGSAASRERCVEQQWFNDDIQGTEWII
ncbi:MAG: hypothetical protein AB2L14_26330 [Candidatus Xenobiia bacterium LiM19]